MKILLVLSTIIGPIVILLLITKFQQLNTFFNGLAVLSILIFGSITSTSLYQIIKDEEVFMTTIHGLFLNVWFMASGAYLGAFIIYRLMKLTWEER